MELQDVIDNLKIQLFGTILQSEIDDDGFKDIINVSLQELGRYYNVTELVEVPGATCIDLKKYPKIETIVDVFRTKGVGTFDNKINDSTTDPALISQLQMYNLANNGYTNDWMYRYGVYSTLQRISNTMSTDLEFKEDKKGKKLYINLPQGIPEKLTVEYIPRLTDVSDIVSTYWQDILLRLSLAQSKIALGRVRTRYTQEGALWSGDGGTILAEGQAELADIRERLRVSTDYSLFVD